MQNFLLVGGTALALQLGHRTSTDIDLFYNISFDTELLRKELETDFECEIKSVYRFALFLQIEKVKTDIVYQKSKILNPIVLINGVRMASLQDLAAMKLMAITNRGKLRDFVDIYILLQQFNLNEMMWWWKEKFNNENYELVLRSLTYFEDAQEESNLKWFFAFDWEKIKNEIVTAVRNFSL
jgi:predicted nucleotidyltransferase component of viral defense system